MVTEIKRVTQEGIVIATFQDDDDDHFETTVGMKTKTGEVWRNDLNLTTKDKDKALHWNDELEFTIAMYGAKIAKDYRILAFARNMK